MTRRHCALVFSGWTCVTGPLVLAALCGGVTPGQTATAPVTGEHIKTFDFDERPLGNFEDTPMYWQPLTGDGLPPYSAGRIDDDLGHDAAPSFVLTVRGGSVAYEYEHDDLNVLPFTDYVVTGYVRAQSLEWASALLYCYLVDGDSNRIAGSERVSAVVRSVALAEGDEPWQRLEVPVPVDHAGASAIRVQLWVLQNYVYQDPPSAEVDPIIRQEVNARVWFDDVTITRVPRARLRLSNPGGVVKPGAEETLQCDVQNATPAALQIELSIVDEHEAERVRESFELAARAAEQRAVPLATLDPGFYRAELRMTEGTEVRAHRSIHFAVLPPLAVRSQTWERFGVELGRWCGGTTDGPAELITTLGCAALKVGVPMLGKPDDDEEAAVLRRPRELAQRLAQQGIKATGVICSPTIVPDPGSRAAVRPVLAGRGAWAENVGPTLAYFGGVITTWQLGHERTELSGPGGWGEDALESFERRLERFVAIPRLVVPYSIFDAPPAPQVLNPAADEGSPDATASVPAVGTGTRVRSYWIPASVPARALPWHLAFWLEPAARPDTDGFLAGPGGSADPVSRWLAVGVDRDSLAAPAERSVDLARRIILAAAVNPERLFIPAPFELTTAGGCESWQPAEEYIALRTLVAHLAESRAVTSLALDHDAVGLLFKHPRRFTLIVWTWQDNPAGATVDLDVGLGARAVDLWGTVQPLTFNGPRARLPLTPAPLIVYDVDAPLLLLPRTFSVEPTFVQLHDPEPRPVLSLRNTYPVELTGTIELTPPATWEVLPTPIRMRLAPDEALFQPLEFVIPAREVASGQSLGVDIHIRQPTTVDLHVDVPMQVGLRDLCVEVQLIWEGDDLVIEQALTNRSPELANFDAFCQPPERAQLQGVFLEVPPGKTQVQTYRLTGARALTGTAVWMGVREIGGQRTLDQLVVVPP